MTESTDTPYAPVIRTRADLETAWRHLVGPLDFHGCSLRLMLIQGDDRPMPQLIEIDHCPRKPEQRGVEKLVAMLAQLCGDHPGTESGATDRRWAVLRCREGSADTDDDDRAWAAALHTAGAAAGVRLEPLHVATGSGVRPVPIDEVGLARAARVTRGPTPAAPRRDRSPTAPSSTPTRSWGPAGRQAGSAG